MSCAVKEFGYGTGLSRWCCHVHELKKISLGLTLVNVIFYCAKTTTLHMPDWKFSESSR